MAELPHLVEVSKKFASEGGAVLLISHDLAPPGETWKNVEPKLRKFLIRKGCDLPVLVFPGDLYNAVAARFGIGPVPTTVAIDRRGKIVAVHEGAASTEELSDLMRQAMR